MRQPIQFSMLCVIAREQIIAEPSIDNLEWGERVKDRLLALGFTYPTEPDGIHRAMRAVEAALSRQWGPRPPQVSAISPAPPSGPSPLTHIEAVDALAQLGALGLVKTIPNVPRFTQHQADSLLVIKLLARATIDQIQRCEEAERAAAAAEAAAIEAHAEEEPTS